MNVRACGFLSVLWWGFFTSGLHASFITLTQAQRYAESHPEYVKSDNDNWLHPSFESFHKSNHPSWIWRTLSWLGIYSLPFDVGHFERTLESTMTRQEKRGFSGEFAERFTPQKNDQCIIWGDLFSAFHSLVRDLTYLKKEGVLDDTFKIIKENYYFIFNGNVVDGSPYVLETLALVLQLMGRNPDRIFYTRGTHEGQERWKDFELLDELKIRGAPYYVPFDSFKEKMSRFFDALPIALYLTQEQEQSIDVVLISNNKKAPQLFSEKNLASIFSQERKRGYFYFDTSHNNTEQSFKAVKLQSYITGEDRTISYHATKGLTLVGAFKGATKWIVFSSPTERNQKLYKFSYDAFVNLNVANGMGSWTLTLFNQKVPELSGFAEAAVYNMVTGREIFREGERSRDIELSFGASMDLSKGASPIGKKVKEGLELAFDRELATNSVPGIVPQLTIVDDEYTPTKTRGAVQEFLKDGITLLIGSQGSASLESYLDLIKQGEVLVLFPFTGSPLFRKPELKHLIHYRGSYIREGEELIKYALKDLKAKKIAIFYQNDAFGRGALEGARRALKEAGITNYIEVPHERNVVNYRAQAEQIKEANPDTLLFSTNTLAIRELIRQLGVQYFAGKKLLGLSVYEDAFERYLKDKGLESVLVRMVPDPKISMLPIAKEYREWADRRNVPYDKVSFEQYINASILFQILRMIEGPINKESIIAVAEQFKDFPFKGLLLDFNPETRELSDTLWIDPGEGAWIERRLIKKEEIPTKPRVEQKSVHPSLFRLGTTLDLSKVVKEQGEAVKAGLEIRLRQAHATQKKDIPELVIADDEYNPAKTRKEVEQFIQNGIHILICPVGSPTLESYLNLIKDGQISVLFPVTGAPLFRDATLTNIVNLRVSYAAEGRILTEYALEVLKSRKLALFYQNDAFGRGLLDAARQVLQKRGIEKSLEVPYDRYDSNFSRYVERIKEYDPDAILFFSTMTATRTLINELGIPWAQTKQLLGNSDLGEAPFKQFLQENSLPFIYANVVPNPETSELQIVRQFREAAHKFGLPLNTFSLESYIAMDLLLYVLDNIDKPITRQKIIAELAAISGVDYKGLFLQFNPQNRTLLHSLWLDTGAQNWKKIDLLTSNKKD